MTPPPTKADRRFARALAARSIARGDPTGWFERLYVAAAGGTVRVPWVDHTPNARLVSALAGRHGTGRALVVGCALGDDAEHVASRGYATVAFDVSATAVAGARRRFPHSTVEYAVADLLAPPPAWRAGFDLVVEVFTVQVLTGDARRAAIARLADLVAPGGRLLVIAGARDEHEPAGTMPWPLTRTELASFQRYGLAIESIVDYLDAGPGNQSVRRWEAWFTAPTK